MNNTLSSHSEAPVPSNLKGKPKRMCRIIDKESLREKAGPGKLPAFAYSGGTRHVLLPNGQQIRHPAEQKDRSLSGKAARRQRIKERHAVIIGTKVIVGEQL